MQLPHFLEVGIRPDEVERSRLSPVDQEVLSCHEPVRDCDEVDPFRYLLRGCPALQGRELHDARPQRLVFHHREIEIGQHSSRVDAVAGGLGRHPLRQVLCIGKEAMPIYKDAPLADGLMPHCQGRTVRSCLLQIA